MSFIRSTNRKQSINKSISSDAPIVPLGMTPVNSTERSQLGMSHSGVETETITLTRQSFGDENGLFFFLGTDGYKKPWSNPMLSDRLIGCASSVFYGLPSVMTDRAGPTGPTWHTNNNGFQLSGYSHLTFTIPSGYYFKPTELTFLSRSDSTSTMPSQIVLLGWENNQTAPSQLMNWSPGFSTSSEWKASAVTAAIGYRMFSMLGTSSGYFTGTEFEMYGMLTYPKISSVGTI